MKNIAVLGNSHVGSLKLAWDQISDTYPDYELTYFASRQLGLSGLTVSGSCLTPTSDTLKREIAFTSGGLEKICPEDFDAIVLYALGASPYWRDPAAFFSERAERTALEDLNSSKLSFALLQKIRMISKKPCFIGHIPLRARRISDDSNDRSAEYALGIATLNEILYTPMQARMIRQPSETIIKVQATDLRFSKGSLSLNLGDKFSNIAHGDDDKGHMNTEFGGLWLGALFSQLDAFPPIQVSGDPDRI